MIENVESKQSTMLNLKTKKRKRNNDCNKSRIKRNENEKRKRNERKKCDETKTWWSLKFRKTKLNDFFVIKKHEVKIVYTTIEKHETMNEIKNRLHTIERKLNDH